MRKPNIKRLKVILISLRKIYKHLMKQMRNLIILFYLFEKALVFEIDRPLAGKSHLSLFHSIVDDIPITASFLLHIQNYWFILQL